MKRFLVPLALVASQPAAAGADLHIRLEVSPSQSVRVDQPISFHLTVANDGPDAASNVVASSSPFNPFLVPPPSPSSGTCPFFLMWASNPSEGIDYWAWTVDFGTLQPGASESCRLDVPGLTTATSIPFSANVRSYSPTIDPDASNNIVTGRLTAFTPRVGIPTLSQTGMLAMIVLIAGGAQIAVYQPAVRASAGSQSRIRKSPLP